MFVPASQGFPLSAEHIKIRISSSHSDVTISARTMSLVSLFRQAVEFYRRKKIIIILL